MGMNNGGKHRRGHRGKRGDKKTAIIAGSVIAAVAACAAGGVIIWNVLGSRPVAEDTVREYFDRLNQGDYAGMYALLSDDSKKQYTEEAFVERNQNIYEGIEASDIKITLAEGETLLAMIPELKDVIGEEDGISYESVLKKRDEINDVLKGYGIMMLTCYHPKARAIFARSEDWEPSQNTKLASVGEISHQGHPHISSSSYIELSDAAGLLADYTFDAIEAPIVDFASSEAYAFAKSVSIFEEPPLPVFLLMTRRIFSNLSASEKEVILESAELSRYYADSLLKRAEETILIRLGKEKRLLEEN